MFFEQNRCIKCGATECLEKLVSNVLEKDLAKNKQAKIGDVVKEHIEEAKSEIKKEKDKLRNTSL